MARLSKHLSPTKPSLPACSITNFEKAGYKVLSHIAQLIPCQWSPISFTVAAKPPPSPPQCVQDWPSWLHWLQSLPTTFEYLFPDQSLLLPRPERQKLTESAIRFLASLPQYHNDVAPADTFASNGSTISLSPDTHAMNFAVIANTTAFAASISHHGSETNIQHGESYGIAAASILALDSNQPTTTLYSDHQNSVNLLNSQLPPHP